MSNRGNPSIPEIGAEEMHSALLRVYAPTSILVYRDLQPIRFFGNVGDYLQFPDGAVRFDLPSILKGGLREAVLKVVQSIWNGADTSSDSIAFRDGDTSVLLTVTARRLDLYTEDESTILISFEERGSSRASSTEKGVAEKTQNREREPVSVDSALAGGAVDEATDSGSGFTAGPELLQPGSRHSLHAEETDPGADRIELLIDNLPEVVWMAAPGWTRMLYVSPVFEKLWRRPVEEMYRNPRAYLDDVHPQDRVELQSKLDAWKGERRIFEYRIRPAGSDEIWVRDCREAVRDRDGNRLCEVGSIFDITSDVRYARELSRSEERFRGIFDKASIGIALLSRDARFIAANAYISRWLEHSSAELASLELLNLVHPEDRTECARLIQETMAGERNEFEVDQRFQNVTKQERWGRLKVTRIDPTSDEEPCLVAVVNDIGEERAAEETAYKLAHYDPLTSLPNRSLMFDRLREQGKLARRSGKPFYVLFVDLDSYKEINDTAGHDVGDRVLEEVADRLRAAVRDTDTVARFGGDEFVLILSEMEHLGVMERICRNLLQQIAKPYRVEHEEYRLSASIGIAVYPDDTRDLEKLIQCADTAMYASKNSGGNTFSFYSGAMNADIKERVRVKNELRLALENDELRLFFQPIYNCQSGLFDKAEALVRWPHPSRGIIMPADFIPLAEHSELIRDLDLWVFDRVVRFLQENESELSDLRSICLNVSAAGIRSPLFERRLKEASSHLSRIDFENSERIYVKPGQTANRAFQLIREHGGRISIDDFGSGYSSLSQLQETPVDTLKIDARFIDTLDGGSDANQQEFIDAIVAIAKAIGADVIAEGVETREQVESLRHMERMHLQGYFFARPMPFVEFVRFMRDPPSLSSLLGESDEEDGESEEDTQLRAG